MNTQAAGAVDKAANTRLALVMLVLPAVGYAVGLFNLPQPTNVVAARTTMDRTKLEGDVILKQAPSPRFPSSANFGGKITVMGLDVPDAVVGPGARVPLTFYFKAEGEMQESWKVFLHVDNQGGRYRIHGDHFPPAGYGTEKWTKGDMLADRYQLWVPLDAQKGTYDIWMGFYDSAHEEERLPLAPIDGVATDGQNRVKLGTLVVN